jgi:hypothetical protein
MSTGPNTRSRDYYLGRQDKDILNIPVILLSGAPISVVPSLPPFLSIPFSPRPRDQIRKHNAPSNHSLKSDPFDKLRAGRSVSKAIRLDHFGFRSRAWYSIGHLRNHRVRGNLHETIQDRCRKTS